MKKRALLLPLLAFPLTSHGTELAFSGFLTAAGGKTLEKDTTYRVEPTNQGAYDNEIRFDPESVAGLQVQAVINDQLRGTLQLIAKGYDGFESKLEWAYITYQLTPELELNAGRYRLPLFYYSEFLDVGYAYHWIRPPVEVYSTFTSALEGFNLVHKHFWGDVEISSQIWYGAIDETLDDGTYYDTRNNAGINVTFGFEWFDVRLLYNTLDLTTTLPDVPGEFPADITFTAISFLADINNIVWRSEYTHADSELSITSWYASAGYRIGPFLPHYTHAEESSDLTNGETSTDTIGVAWYFNPSAVAKLEYLTSETEFTDQNTDVDVISVALDIIF
ncbi:MAG: hypothetical protein MI808_11420 [Pseudomonadales bacterium]|nr:hypothetical protein [Pseudomonadales bacterium]